MKKIVVVASLALFTLIGCTDNQSEEGTGQTSPPTQTPAESGTAPNASTMSAADRALAEQVKTALQQNPALASAAENIQVFANNGEVTLRGSVNNAQEKESLGSAAAQVAGVSKVNNEVEVSSASR